MSNGLKTTTTLPLTGCTRTDIEDMIEKSVPDLGMADGTTIKVVNDVLVLGNLAPRWTKTVVPFSSVAALGAALTGQITLFTLPDGGVVHAVKVMTTVQWVGAAIATLVADVGTAGTADKYQSAYNMLAAPATDNFDLEFIQGGEHHPVAGTGAGTALKLRVTSTVANLNVISAGSVSVWVLWSATVV